MNLKYFFSLLIPIVKIIDNIKFLAADVLSQLIEGLSFMHENGIMHRDITASNVLISRIKDGRLFVVCCYYTFGILCRNLEIIRFWIDEESSGQSSLWYMPWNTGIYRTVSIYDDIWVTARISTTELMPIFN